jgi:arylformamidase
MGPAVVVQFTPGPIDRAALESTALPGDSARLLLKTGAEAGAVTPDGARWLVERGVRLVGADTLSIEPETTGLGVRGCPPEEQFPVHRILLGAGVVIVEGLDLAAVAPGSYQFVCLPLRIVGGDGAPARAVLIRP